MSDPTPDPTPDPVTDAMSDPAAEAAGTDLTGHLLIAMPDMGDGRFAGGVVFLCRHGAEGAMGVLVNKPLPDLGFADMLEQLDIDHDAPVPQVPLCYGGPMDQRRGFVLHSAEYRGRQADALPVDDRFTMTATLDVVEDLANGTGPAQALMALGYAGWGPGQLEAELRDNGWLTCPARPDLVFDTPMDAKWEAALASLGIHPLMLSATSGRA